MATSPNLGSEFSAYGSPIVVATIAKMSKWSNLQTLGHDAALKDSILTFHGVRDALDQFHIYTAGNPTILTPGMEAVEPMVLENSEVDATMVPNVPLGCSVGPSVAAIPTMGAVFSTSAAQLGEGSQAVAATMAS